MLLFHKADVRFEVANFYFSIVDDTTFFLLFGLLPHNALSFTRIRDAIFSIHPFVISSNIFCIILLSLSVVSQKWFLMYFEWVDGSRWLEQKATFIFVIHEMKEAITIREKIKHPS